MVKFEKKKSVAKRLSKRTVLPLPFTYRLVCKNCCSLILYKYIFAYDPICLQNMAAQWAALPSLYFGRSHIKTSASWPSHLTDIFVMFFCSYRQNSGQYFTLFKCSFLLIYCSQFTTYTCIRSCVIYYFNLLATDFFFQILAHPVFKMWVIQKPNKVALWNKRRFEEKKWRLYSMFKIFSTEICWINIKWGI